MLTVLFFSTSRISFKRAVELGHSVDWDNNETLEIEIGHHKRKLVESFYKNSLSNDRNDKNLFVFHLQTKLCFRNLITSIFLGF